MNQMMLATLEPNAEQENLERGNAANKPGNGTEDPAEFKLKLSLPCGPLHNCLMVAARQQKRRCTCAGQDETATCHTMGLLVFAGERGPPVRGSCAHQRGASRLTQTTVNARSPPPTLVPPTPTRSTFLPFSPRLGLIVVTNPVLHLATYPFFLLPTPPWPNAEPVANAAAPASTALALGSPTCPCAVPSLPKRSVGESRLAGSARRPGAGSRRLPGQAGGANLDRPRSGGTACCLQAGVARRRRLNRGRRGWRAQTPGAAKARRRKGA